ncbi:MAG: type I-F CRISPR-associated protein Csy3 [Neisseriaceae bacterium]|nr:type I-F CRISPR-associated protein Csy3 [Neisseriaceae bacterium]
MKTASVLAFERKLECSDAFFNQTASNAPELPQSPIKIREKSVRGTISNRLKDAIANDPLKLDAEVQKANPQTVDYAALDEDKDMLIAGFTLKILPFDGSPYLCNDKEYQQKLQTTVSGCLKDSIPELARRYACNIANARWLWRNRMGAEHIKISVKNKDETVEIADAKQLPLNEFNDNAEIKRIAQWVEQGLTGEQYTLLAITAYAQMGMGQEVFPSEELVLDKGNAKGGKSKVLYQNEQGKAGLHSQKIGNAIRTIDNWYPDAQFPIAVEPYGSVTTMGTAFRQPKSKQDFYNLFDKWLLKDQEPEGQQKHYLLAMLIRGGVFGESAKD